jgi:antitoxin (DNA-binding transcriptional repressor) of toxin-antitoxin stability system
MNEVGMHEVRRNLTNLVDRVRVDGEVLVIKDHARKVAGMVPVDVAEILQGSGALASFRELMKENSRRITAPLTEAMENSGMLERTRELAKEVIATTGASERANELARAILNR